MKRIQYGEMEKAPYHPKEVFLFSPAPGIECGIISISQLYKQERTLSKVQLNNKIRMYAVSRSFGIHAQKSEMRGDGAPGWQGVKNKGEPSSPVILQPTIPKAIR
jgi:hypothetical protein